MGIEPYSRRAMPTLRDIFAVLFRQRRTLLAAFAIAIIAFVASGLWIPKYEAQMKILVRRQHPDETATSPATAAPAIGDQVTQEDLNSEVELLKSDDLLRKVAMTTGLSGVSGSPTDQENQVKIAGAVRKLSENLKIEPISKTNVISVQYQDRDPQMATAVLKALASAYSEKNLEVHRTTGDFEFFDQQAEQYRQALDQAQKKLTEFTNGTGVVSADLERDDALRQADEFDSIARQAQTTLHETEQRIVELQAQLQTIKPRMTTAVHTSDNPQLLEELKSTLLNLQMKRTDLLSKFQPTDAPVHEVDDQIAETGNAITAEESKPLRDETSDQNPDFEWVRAEITKDQADLSGLKARAAEAESISAQYHEAARRLSQNGLVQQDLLRAAKTQEDNYILYEHKREEARIGDAFDERGVLNLGLVEQPAVPAVPTRSPLNLAFLVLFLAGSFSLTTAFVVDFMDPSFRTPDELAHYLRAPVLAALPKGGE
jgi:uncharacterized protein involved in exopolysaccharide biosynthesis